MEGKCVWEFPSEIEASRITIGEWRWNGRRIRLHKWFSPKVPVNSVICVTKWEIPKVLFIQQDSTIFKIPLAIDDDCSEVGMGGGNGCNITGDASDGIGEGLLALEGDTISSEIVPTSTNVLSQPFATEKVKYVKEKLGQKGQVYSYTIPSDAAGQNGDSLTVQLKNYDLGGGWNHCGRAGTGGRSFIIMKEEYDGSPKEREEFPHPLAVIEGRRKVNRWVMEKYLNFGKFLWVSVEGNEVNIIELLLAIEQESRLLDVEGRDVMSGLGGDSKGTHIGEGSVVGKVGAMVQLLCMDSKIISWNVREMNDPNKRAIIKVDRFCNCENGLEWGFGGVYGLWGGWDIPWVLGGDFNTIRYPKERVGCIMISRAMEEFYDFNDNHFLVELPLTSVSFTWSRSKDSSSR
ncbi:unnamed protein product [Withania somnifera]